MQTNLQSGEPTVFRNNLSRILNTPISSKVIIYAMLIYVVVMRYATTALSFPGYASFLLDVLNVLALVFALKRRRALHGIGFKAVIFIFATYCCALLITDILNGVQLPLIAWAMRNTFRLFVFFYACVALLDKSDIDRLFKMMFCMQIINVIVTLYQFGALGLRQDYLGGIFGIAEGCNAYTNVFMSMLLVYYGFKWLDGDKGCTAKLLFVVVSSLIIAALAELKVFFLEFACLVVVLSLMRIGKVRSILGILISVVALIMGLQVFKAVFPQAYSDMMDIDEMVAYSTEGMAGYELSRFGSFEQIDSLIFNKDPVRSAFGVGFGGAEESNISLFTSSFSQVWGYLNYRWFTHQMTFIETGYVGFCLFVMVFVVYAIWLMKKVKRVPESKVLIQFSFIMTLFTIINFWYNCATRIECCYFIAFSLAVGAIAVRASFSKSR